MSKAHKNISLEITNNVQKKNQTENDKKQPNRKDVARRRWGILAKALKSPISSQPSSPTDEISMRRFSTFMLLTTQQIHDEYIEKQPTQTANGIKGHQEEQNQINKETHCQNQINGDNKKNCLNECSPRNCEQNNYNKEHNLKQSSDRRKQHPYNKRSWYRYSANLNKQLYYVDVAHTARSFTAVDLMGFNNTGNVCVWPSEEALAYYALNNLEQFQNKTVLELGAGMSALAGLMIAKYASPKLIHLTDGNSLAVENIKSSLKRNTFDTFVSCAILQWGTNRNDNSIYDVILSADCLFFDEARCDLIETIWKYLAENGIAYVMAPKRGDTLDIFMDHSAMRGFVCKKLIVYDRDVWNRHLEYLDNPDYDETIIIKFLVLSYLICDIVEEFIDILMQKYSADYWKSQAKKYCEFCKCWLADNKPSIEFHEKGRKHKENVARKLRTISKTSRREQKEAIQEDLALRRMESAALEAYRKDVEKGADISSKVIQKQLETSSAKSSIPWHEVASKDGPSYYWNVETNESVWEPPSGGYLSVAEQQVETFRKGKQQLNAVHKFQRTQDRLKLEEQKQQQEEERAAAERRKMKARRVVEEEPPSVIPGPILEPSYGPYGPWKTVETKPKKQVDLQLPKKEEYVVISIPVDKPEPVKLFKEKTVVSLAEDENCTSSIFKKRKFSANKSRNVRQRVEDV